MANFCGVCANWWDRRCRIVITLDLHANISERRWRSHSTALVTYRGNPHLDQEERGREAARLLARTMRGEVRPVQALEAPPLFVQISKQYTAVRARPLAVRRSHSGGDGLAWESSLPASAMGFYYADVPEMGTTFVAVADGDAGLARRAARWMAGELGIAVTSSPAIFPTRAPPSAMPAGAPKKPVVLMDVGD